MRLGAPLLHRLIAGAIYVHLVVNKLHPTKGNVMMLALVVAFEFDRLVALHVIDLGELAIVGTDDRHMWLDLICVCHELNLSNPCATDAISLRAA